MLRTGIIIVLLVAGAAPAAAITREGCAAEGGLVEPSGRGGDWWKCCLKIPSAILRGERTKICFVCDGESPRSNCDQIPYVGKDEKKPSAKSTKQDAKKVE